uniref:Mono(ADP-ribosyl)transferase n=1 Tax=Cryptomonas curvata TaxID=233186 RepID=A0A6T8BFF1_9CRYP
MKLDEIGLFVEDGDFREDFEELIKTWPGHDSVLDSKSCIATFVKWQRDAEILRSSRLNRVVAKLIRNSVRKEHPDSDSSRAMEIFMQQSEVEIPGKILSDQLKEFLKSKDNSIDLTGHNESDKYSDLSLGPLKLFHDGLETHLGYPALDVLTAMKSEHLGDGLFERFSGKLASPGYLQNIRNVSKIVNPETEWYQVIDGNNHNQQQNVLEIPHRQVEEDLNYYCDLAERKVRDALSEAEKLDSGALLSREEVAAIRLWTGPMFKRYALFFRACITGTEQMKSIQYATTMHAINSAITKLAKIWKLPLSRKVYRGYNNLQPGECAQLRDTSRCRGGVDPCVLATSEDFDVAVAYSKHGFILEIEVGQVDRGADISWLSQFPHEREILFQALSNLEFVGEPRNFFTEDGKIQLHAIRINANLKSKTLDQFKEMRKDLHLATVKNIRENLQCHLKERLSMFQATLLRRQEGYFELLNGDSAQIEIDDNAQKTSTVCFRGDDMSRKCTIGAMSCGQEISFEVEIMNLETSGRPAWLWLGLAGTNFGGDRTGGMGLDNVSWAYNVNQHACYHGEVKMPMPIPEGLSETDRDSISKQQLWKGLKLVVEYDMNAKKIYVSRNSLRETAADRVSVSNETGALLFPIITAWGGCTVKVRLLCSVTSCPALRSAQDILFLQLLGYFDQIQTKHEEMAAVQYNTDQKYKILLNEALDAKVGLDRKQEALITMMLSGANPTQLSVCIDSPPVDFVTTVTTILENECQYTWRSALAPLYFAGLGEISIPLKLPPCQIAVIWREILSQNVQNDTRKVILGDVSLSLVPISPILNLKENRLVDSKFEGAINGLMLALNANFSSENPAYLGSSAQLGVDFRDIEYTQKSSEQLLGAVHEALKLGYILSFNGRKVDCLEPDYLDALIGAAANEATVLSLAAKDCRLTGPQTSALNGLSVMKKKDLNFQNCVLLPTVGKCQKSQELGKSLDAMAWGFVTSSVATRKWEQIDLSENALDSSHMKLLLVGISFATTLSCITLRKNNIGSTGCALLVPGLFGISNLKWLHLE